MKKIIAVIALLLLIASGSSAGPPVSAPAMNLLPGTYTDGGYCTYTSSGTLLNCQKLVGTDIQAYSATLAAYAALTEAAGSMIYFTADNVPAALGIGTAYQILQTNAAATAPEWTSSLSISALDLTSATSSIPWVVATSTPGTFNTNGMAWYDSDAYVLQVRDQANTRNLTFYPAEIAQPVISQEVLIDCDGSASPYAYCTGANASTLTSTYAYRSIINSYGRGEAQTVTLPTAAAGMTFIAIVGTQHNSAWKIQRAGSDTITWSAAGIDTAGKTYFQETNQAVGSRVSCITYKTGASAWSWLCGSVTGTWVTD